MAPPGGLKDPGVELNSVTISPVYAFGANGTASSSIVAHTGESKIVFPVGRHLAELELDSKKMTFVMERDKVSRIHSVAVAPNLLVLAVIEELVRDPAAPPQSEANFQVSIYDVERAYWFKSFALGHDVAQSATLVHLAFSPDSKRLLVQAGHPDWVLTCWQWNLGKLVCWSRHLPISYSGQATADNRISQVSVNPWKTELYASTGPKAVNLWRALENDRNLRGVSLISVHRDDVEYTEHAWLMAERLAVATTSGEILVFDKLLSNVKRFHSGDWVLTGLVPAAPGKQLLSIWRTRRGFAASTADGVLLFFEQSGQNLDSYDAPGDSLAARQAEAELAASREAEGEKRQNPYVLIKAVQAAINMSIRSLSLAPAEGSLACFVGGAHVGSAHMATLLLSNPGDQPLELAASGYHSGNILGMDMCFQVSLAATVGDDRYVRLWNYTEHTCRLAKGFLDPLTSVAIHPNGLQLLVGVSDRLRLYHILSDDLALAAEFPIRGCELVRYSHGGAQFAAVDRNVIQIYSSITHAVLASFKGHTGSIRSLTWSENDLKIASAGTEGAVYEWRIDTLSRDRSKEHVIKNCRYAAVAFTMDGNAMVASGSDACIRSFVDGVCDLEVPTGVNVTALHFLHDGHLLLAGTELGTLRAYAWPPSIVGGAVAYQEVRLHQDQVTHIQVAPSGRLIMSGSGDGSIFLCDVSLPERPKPAGAVGLTVAESEIVLYLKSDVVEREKVMMELESSLKQAISEKNYLVMMKNQGFTDQIERLQRELASAHQAVQDERGQTHRVHNEGLEAVHAAQAAAEREHMLQDAAQAALVQKLVDAERELATKAVADARDKRLRTEEDLRRAQVAATEVLTATVGEYEAKVASLQDKIAGLEKAAELRAQMDGMALQMTEDELEGELSANTQMAISKQLEERARYSKKVGAAHLQIRQLMTAAESAGQALEKLRLKEIDMSRMNMQLDDQKRLVESLQTAASEQERRIKAKDQQLFDLQDHVRELEKRKFILEYKLGQARSAAEPRELKLQEAEAQVQKLDSGFEGQYTALTKLERLAQERQERNLALQNELNSLRGKLAERDRKIQAFSSDLTSAVTTARMGSSSQQLAEIKKLVLELHHNYASEKDDVAAVPLVQKALTEVQRQREHLELTKKTLLHQLRQNRTDKEHEKLLAQSHNALLLAENADLRRDLKRLRADLYKTQDRLRQFQAGFTRAQSPPTYLTSSSSGLGLIREISGDAAMATADAMPAVGVSYGSNLMGASAPPRRPDGSAGMSRPTTAAGGLSRPSTAGTSYSSENVLAVGARGLRPGSAGPGNFIAQTPPRPTSALLGGAIRFASPYTVAPAGRLGPGPIAARAGTRPQSGHA